MRRKLEGAPWYIIVLRSYVVSDVASRLGITEQYCSLLMSGRRAGGAKLQEKMRDLALEACNV